MDQYTKLLEEKAEMLSPEEEGYEAVYYFCIRNGLPYPETREILAQIPEITESEKTVIPAACEPLYTSMLTNMIDVYCLNHTVYQVSAYSSDKTLAVCQPASLKSSNWQDYHLCRLEQKLREYEVIVHGSPGRRQHDRIYLRQTAWHSIPN